MPRGVQQDVPQQVLLQQALQVPRLRELQLRERRVFRRELRQVRELQPDQPRVRKLRHPVLRLRGLL